MRHESRIACHPGVNLNIPFRVWHLTCIPASNHYYGLQHNLA